MPLREFNTSFMYPDATFFAWKKYVLRFVQWVLIPGMLIALAAPGCAIEIFQWVDEAGKISMSDVVPEKYRATAKRVNSRKYELSDVERSDADARAAKEKSRADRIQVEMTEPPESPEPPEKAVAPKPVKTAKPVTCEQKWDAYHHSQECFAPFFIRTGQGSSLRPEAYQACQVVESPAMVCHYDKRVAGQ